MAKRNYIYTLEASLIREERRTQRLRLEEMWEQNSLDIFELRALHGDEEVLREIEREVMYAKNPRYYHYLLYQDLEEDAWEVDSGVDTDENESDSGGTDSEDEANNITSEDEESDDDWMVEWFN